jgi:hypothetical protein
MKQHKNTVNTSTRTTKTPTHYKTHIYAHPHITKLIHTHTHTLRNPHVYTPHITKQVKTTRVQDTHEIK